MSKRKSKLCSLAEALAFVQDGDKIIAAGAHYNNIPMALVRELVRRRVKNLEIIPTPSAGLWVDMLIGAGAVAKVHVSYIGMEFLGLAPNFRRAAESKAIAVDEKDEPTIWHGLRAAGSGLPFVALPPLQLMTDLPKLNTANFADSAVTREALKELKKLSPHTRSIRVHPRIKGAKPAGKGAEPEKKEKEKETKREEEKKSS